MAGNPVLLGAVSCVFGPSRWTIQSLFPPQEYLPYRCPEDETNDLLKVLTMISGL